MHAYMILKVGGTQSLNLQANHGRQLAMFLRLAQRSIPVSTRSADLRKRIER